MERDGAIIVKIKEDVGPSMNTIPIKGSHHNHLVVHVMARTDHDTIQVGAISKGLRKGNAKGVPEVLTSQV